MSKQLRFSGDQRGFTITELLVSTAVILIVTGSALATFQTALGISDTATQFADANQNLRAGVNQLIKDTMQGRGGSSGRRACRFRAEPGPSRSGARDRRAPR